MMKYFLLILTLLVSVNAYTLDVESTLLPDINGTISGIEQKYKIKSFIISKQSVNYSFGAESISSELEREEYIYSDEKLRQVNQINSDDTRIPIVSYEYNLDGLLVAVVEQFYNSTHKTKSIYSYDSSNKLKTESHFGIEGNKVKEVIYNYTEGRLSNYISMNESGNPEEKTVFSYDQFGNITKVITLKLNGSKSYETFFEYIDDKLVLETYRDYTIFEDGDYRERRTRYIWENKSSNPSQKIVEEFYGDPITTSYKYSNDNLLIEVFDNSDMSYKEIQRDDKGFPIKMIHWVKILEFDEEKYIRTKIETISYEINN